MWTQQTAFLHTWLMADGAAAMQDKAECRGWVVTGRVTDSNTTQPSRHLHTAAPSANAKHCTSPTIPSHPSPFPPHHPALRTAPNTPVWHRVFCQSVLQVQRVTASPLPHPPAPTT